MEFGEQYTTEEGLLPSKTLRAKQNKHTSAALSSLTSEQTSSWWTHLSTFAVFGVDRSRSDQRIFETRIAAEKQKSKHIIGMDPESAHVGVYLNSPSAKIQPSPTMSRLLTT
jgi:hypothetical protein